MPTQKLRYTNNNWVLYYGDQGLSSNQPPTAAVVTTVDNANSAKIYVDATTSGDSDGTIVAYDVDWGDNSAHSTGAGGTYNHTYTASGTYAIVVKVTDNDGGSATVTKNQTVTVPSGGGGGTSGYGSQDTGGTGVEPTGTSYASVSGLSGSTLNAKINATTKNATFPTGTFTWDDFANPSSQTTNPKAGRGLNITAAAGLVGSGSKYTILKMNPGSTTKYADMTGSTIDLHYIYLNGQVKLIKDLTIQGTSIGDLSKLANGSNSSNGGGNKANDSPYIYNGFYLYNTSDLHVENVKMIGIPGSDHVNPGETFDFNWYHGSNTSFLNVEIDGAGIGSSGFGPNNAVGPLYFDHCSAHDLKYSCGWAIYKCQGKVTILNPYVARNHAHFNFEMNYDNLDVEIRNPMMDRASSTDFNFGTNNTLAGAGSATVNIYDPVDLNGNPVTTIKIKCPPTYGSDPTNPNLQKRSDIHVWRGSTEVTSSVVLWSN